MRRVIKRVVAWSIAVLLLLAIVWTIWNWRAARRLEAVLAEIRASGLPTTFAELEQGLPPYGPAPADEENAAHLYRAAEFLLRATRVPEELWAEIAEYTIPPVPAELRSRLGDLDEVCDLLHRAARLPRCRFDLRWSDGFSMELPHLNGMRRLAMLLAARAVVRAEDGEVDGAIEDLRALFALGRAFREEPLVISQLVRITIAGLGIEALQRVLPRCPSAVEALERVDPDGGEGGVAFGLQAELVSLLQLADADGGLSAMLDSNPRLPWYFIFTVGLPYVRSDLAFLWEYTLRHIEAARQPYPAAIALAADLEPERDSGGLLSTLFLLDWSHAIRREARQASRVALARLAARCLDHRRAHGSLPADLGAIGGDPLDPLSGKPFVLEPIDGGGIVLRSPGDDEVRWELEPAGE